MHVILKKIDRCGDYRSEGDMRQKKRVSKISIDFLVFLFKCSSRRESYLRVSGKISVHVRQRVLVKRDKCSSR